MFGKNIETKMIVGYILFLLIIFLLVSCDSGWSIAGWEIK